MIKYANIDTCFRMQQGGNGGQEDDTQRRNMNEHKAFIRSLLHGMRAALFSAKNTEGRPSPSWKQVVA